MKKAIRQIKMITLKNSEIYCFIRVGFNEVQILVKKIKYQYP